MLLKLNENVAYFLPNRRNICERFFIFRIFQKYNLNLSFFGILSRRLGTAPGFKPGRNSTLSSFPSPNRAPGIFFIESRTGDSAALIKVHSTNQKCLMVFRVLFSQDLYCYLTCHSMDDRHCSLSPIVSVMFHPKLCH